MLPEKPKPVKGLKTQKKRMTKHQQRQRLIWQYVITCKLCVKAGHKATFTAPGKNPNDVDYICRLCNGTMTVKNVQVMGLEEAKQLIP